MMMTAFAAMETVHVAAYSHLLDTIGMPESEYSNRPQDSEEGYEYDQQQERVMSMRHEQQAGLIRQEEADHAHNPLLLLIILITLFRVLRPIRILRLRHTNCI
jgi:ribonucleotide reductase beta subunit family protein with ferritin-like domain